MNNEEITCPEGYERIGGENGVITCNTIDKCDPSQKDGLCRDSQVIQPTPTRLPRVGVEGGIDWFLIAGLVLLAIVLLSIIRHNKK